MKHESSYTLHVLQLGAPLSVTVERSVVCSFAWRRVGGLHRKLHYFTDA